MGWGNDRVLADEPEIWGLRISLNLYGKGTLTRLIGYKDVAASALREVGEAINPKRDSSAATR